VPIFATVYVYEHGSLLTQSRVVNM